MYFLKTVINVFVGTSVVSITVARYRFLVTTPVGPDRPAAAPQEPELGVHDGQTLDSLETPSASAQEEEEEPEKEEITDTAVERMDASKKYGWDLQGGSESTTQVSPTNCLCCLVIRSLVT
jgi:hypothetical protein